MRQHARCRTLRRILSRVLLVLGGTLAATVVGWLLSASQASASGLDHHGEQAAQPNKQEHEPTVATVDTVAGRLGHTARSAAGHVGSTVDATRHGSSTTPSPRYTGPPHTREARTDRAHEAGAAVRDTAAAATSGVRKTAENVRHGAARAAKGLRDRVRSGHGDLPRVPRKLDPGTLPGVIAKHGNRGCTDGSESTGAADSVGAADAAATPETAPAQSAQRHTAAKSTAHAHPSTHRDTARHDTRHGMQEPFRQTTGSAADNGRHDGYGPGSDHHAAPHPMSEGAGTANSSGHQIGGSSGVLPDKALVGRGIVIGVLHRANDHTPVLVNKQPGTSPG